MLRCSKSIPILLTLVLTISAATVDIARAAGRDDLKPWDGKIPLRSAWLRDHLPADTLIYFRVPHPLGFLAAPKGNVMDDALRSSANIEAMLSIQDALIANVLEYVPGFEKPYVREFAARLRSPLEVAVLLAPVPSIIVSMNLDLDSKADIQQLLEEISIGDTPLSLLAPLDEDGFGQIMGLPVPASMNIDIDTGRVLIQAGPAVAADAFSLWVESLVQPQAHKMHKMEQQVDTSGYGLFMWIDAESALPAAQAFLDADQLAGLRESGLDKVRAAAFGWGSANRKGRMSLIIDMPGDGNRKFLPYINNRLSATSVGEPDVIFTLSIPTAEEFLRIEALALAAASEENRKAWLDGKARVEAETGITIENVLGAIGPEMIGIFDRVGDYAAIRLRDKRLFDELVQQISDITGSGPESRRYRRKTIYQWRFTGDPGSLNEEEAALGPLTFVFARQSEHLFWYQDGDFLYVAGLPQPLIERIDAGADTAIDGWLDDTQRLDLTSSFLGVTGTSEKLPRRLYYIYIELLQALADISEAEFDIWSMPTAGQAGLPEKGALGFSINLGDPYLSLEMMFENNPLESIFSGDMTSVAALGIVAAIAIPAYQDYTVRTQISQGLNEAADAKTRVAEYLRTAGELPGPTAAAEINEAISASQYTESIIVLPGSGIVVITYSEKFVPDGGQLFLVPTANGTNITWTCAGTIPNKHLPSVCRGNSPPNLESGGA